MDVRRKKVKVTFFFLALMSLLIVSISFFVYNIISRHVAGPESGFSVLAEYLPFYQADRIRGVRAAVLQSHQTARYIAGNVQDDVSPEEARTQYLQIAEFWQRQLQSRRIRAEIIRDEELVTELHRFNLLILPVSYCLSDAQIRAVKAFLGEQKGLVMTHLTGNRRADGSERSWSLTSDITGGEVRFKAPGAANRYFAGFDTDTPVAANLPVGHPLEIVGHDHPISLHLRDPRTRSAALWNSDSHVVARDLRELTASAYGDYMGGRFVWFGFSASSVPPGQRNWDQFDRLLANAAEWASFRSVAAAGTWPDHGAAAVFGIMADRELPGAQELVDRFADHGIRPGLFLSPTVVPVNRIALERMRPKAEFAPNLGLSSNRIEEESPAFLVEQIQRTRTEVQTQMENPIQGMSMAMVPSDAYERMERMDLNYLWLTDSHAPVPKLVPPGPPRLLRRQSRSPVLIYQGGRSDQYMIEEQGLTEPEAMAHALRVQFDYSRRLGGLYSTTLHPRFVGASRFQGVLDPFLRYVKESGVWTPSPGELASWWRQMELVQISYSQEGRRLNLRISNEGPDAVPLFRVLIYPPDLPDELTIRAERIRTPIPEYRIDRDENRIVLIIDNLRRRENRTYDIDM